MSLQLGDTPPNLIQSSTVSEVNFYDCCELVNALARLACSMAQIFNKRFEAVSNLQLNSANLSVLNQRKVEE
jgi:hypothetical protein